MTCGCALATDKPIRVADCRFVLDAPLTLAPGSRIVNCTLWAEEGYLGPLYQVMGGVGKIYLVNTIVERPDIAPPYSLENPGPDDGVVVASEAEIPEDPQFTCQAR